MTAVCAARDGAIANLDQRKHHALRAARTYVHGLGRGSENPEIAACIDARTRHAGSAERCDGAIDRITFRDSVQVEHQWSLEQYALFVQYHVPPRRPASVTSERRKQPKRNQISANGWIKRTVGTRGKGERTCQDSAEVRRNRLACERSVTIDAHQLALRIMASQCAVNARDCRERRVETFGECALRMRVRTDVDERSEPGLRPPRCVIRGTARAHTEGANGERRR